MIARLRRALEHVDELPPDIQEEIAEQIEQHVGLSESTQHWDRSLAGVWSDLPDDMEETLLRWRHEAPPSPPDA